MNLLGPQRRDPRRVPSLFVSALLVGAGILIGLAVASELGWLPFGHAVPERPLPPQAPTPAAIVEPVRVPPVASGFDQSFVQVAKAVTPAVVNISISRTLSGESPHGFLFEDPFFRRFFGDDFFRRFETPRRHKERNLGSGVIVDPTGLIITNNHVVEKADEIAVMLSDKREFKAKLVGTDAKTDIAVLKVDTEGLHTIPWGDSDRLEVGEFVLAVGNPFGLNQTVTLGIVSAVGRASMGIAEYEDFIQTDAAINPGNSGGALVNVRGELVGINTAIFSQSGGNMGIGFAVPSSMARSILEQLTRNGKVVRGWLGVSIQELTPELAEQFGLAEPKGVLISEVLERSPAKQAGLERGDVIIEYDSRSVETPTQLRNAVARTPVGRKALIKFIRNKQVRTTVILVAEQPQKVAKVPDQEPAHRVVPAGLLSDIEVHDLSADLARRLSFTGGERGVVIVEVRSGSAAEEAGLKEGDVIQEINRRPVVSREAYDRTVSTLQATQPVLLLVKRQGRSSFMILKP